ncbi:MAG: hypothetical protein K0S46_2324 [Moraxellaceae bacterium]|nr:hypothetical protein [Moraxellaceae bacterium]
MCQCGIRQVVNTQPLRETSCKSRRSPFLLLSLPLWPSLAAPRRKKPPLKPLPLLKLLPPLLKLPLRPPKLLRLLTLLLRLLTPLLRLPTPLLRLLRLPSNQPLRGLMQKGASAPFFIFRPSRIPHGAEHDLLLLRIRIGS